MVRDGLKYGDGLGVVKRALKRSSAWNWSPKHRGSCRFGVAWSIQSFHGG